jgi:pimeloyl-ACP methyl ester carboxylesterase
VLADRGYHVIAVDLPGHGQSPHARDYTMRLLADSVLESVPPRPEIAVGHSLGGLTLSSIVSTLRPERAIYVDPAFSFPRLAWWQRALAPVVGRQLVKRTASQIARANPRWDQADVRIEAEDFRLVDRRVLAFLLRPGVIVAPSVMAVPSLAVLADGSQLVPVEAADALRELGFEVRIVGGASHTVNRDDFAAFLAALDGWI